MVNHDEDFFIAIIILQPVPRTASTKKGVYGIMNYQQSRKYLQLVSAGGSVYGLERMQHLLHLLGDPQDALHFIHIAGTNGKGSVQAFLFSILSKSGYRVGCYHSPAVFRYRDIIQINGAPIPKDVFAKYMTQIANASQQCKNHKQQLPTAFEMETALAFLYFQAEHCDIVLLETGLGGTMDATNIVTTTALEIITPISMDHMAFLGNTLTDIATQKAGIIKPNTIVVSAQQPEEVQMVLQKKCTEQHCSLHFVNEDNITDIEADMVKQSFSYKSWKRITITLAGRYQISNASLALEAIEALRKLHFIIPNKAIYSGMAEATWHGRFTICQTNPLLILDGAHNPGAATALRHALQQYCKGKKLYFIMGMFRDKDYETVIKITAPLAHHIFATEPPNQSRALPAKVLFEAIAKHNSSVETAKSIQDAVKKCLQLAKPEDSIVVFGSLSILKDAEAAVHQFTAYRKEV